MKKRSLDMLNGLFVIKQLIHDINKTHTRSRSSVFPFHLATASLTWPFKFLQNALLAGSVLPGHTPKDVSTCLEFGYTYSCALCFFLIGHRHLKKQNKKTEGSKWRFSPTSEIKWIVLSHVENIT